MKIKTYEENTLNIFPFYLRTIDTYFLQPPTLRNTGYEFHQLFLIREGSGIIKIDGKIFNLNKGDLFFLEKGFPHEYYGTTDNFTTAFLSFTATDFDKIKNYYNIKNYGIFYNKNSQIFKSHLEMLFNSLESESSIANLCAKTFLAIISFFDETYLEEKKEIDKVYNYLENNYQKQISLDDLLLIYPYSKSKLCHKFKEKFGMSIFSILTKIRVENAYYIIKTNPNIKLNEVSFLCGFNDTSYFCKMYKKRFNISPKKMIKEL
ncbi:MAG: helix-turn-helix domain-containing protein [Ruminococcaceae bacterium]|nr:helix-turn-helix domain-containing protein [Oscillospiraceae bacterium]